MKRFWFNSNSGRMCIGDEELHCGKCFQIRLLDGWHSTRIEHCSERGWIILFPPSFWRAAVNFNGYEARFQ